MLGTDGRTYNLIHRVGSKSTTYTMFNQHLATIDDELYLVEVENDIVTWYYEIPLKLNKPERSFMKRDDKTQAIIREYAISYKRAKKINTLLNEDKNIQTTTR